MEIIANQIDRLRVDSRGVVKVPAVNGTSKIKDIVPGMVIYEKSFNNFCTRSFSTPAIELMRYGLGKQSSFWQIFQDMTCEQLSHLSCSEHQIGILIKQNPGLFFIKDQIAFFIAERDVNIKTVAGINERFAIISLAIAAGRVRSERLEVCDYSILSPTIDWNIRGVKFFIPQ